MELVKGPHTSERAGALEMLPHLRRAPVRTGTSRRAAPAASEAPDQFAMADTNTSCQSPTALARREAVRSTCVAKLRPHVARDERRTPGAAAGPAQAKRLAMANGTRTAGAARGRGTPAKPPPRRYRALCRAPSRCNGSRNKPPWPCALALRLGGFRDARPAPRAIAGDMTRHRRRRASRVVAACAGRR